MKENIVTFLSCIYYDIVIFISYFMHNLCNIVILHFFIILFNFFLL